MDDQVFIRALKLAQATDKQAYMSDGEQKFCHSSASGKAPRSWRAIVRRWQVGFRF